MGLLLWLLLKQYLLFLCRLTLTTLSKHKALHSAKTNWSKRSFFLMPIEISFRCFFNILLPCRCSLRFPFALFVRYFELINRQKKNAGSSRELKENIPNYSSTDHRNFREKHHSTGLSVKGVTFTSGTNEKLSFLLQYILFNFFFFLIKIKLYYEPKIEILTKSFIWKYPVTLKRDFLLNFV